MSKEYKMEVKLVVLMAAMKVASLVEKKVCWTADQKVA